MGDMSSSVRSSVGFRRCVSTAGEAAPYCCPSAPDPLDRWVRSWPGTGCPAWPGRTRASACRSGSPHRNAMGTESAAPGQRGQQESGIFWPAAASTRLDGQQSAEIAVSRRQGARTPTTPSMTHLGWVPEILGTRNRKPFAFWIRAAAFFATHAILKAVLTGNAACYRARGPRSRSGARTSGPTPAVRRPTNGM
jgi:hypothetical protein